MNYERIVQALGPNYDQLYNQLGSDVLMGIYQTNPELLSQLRPLNQNDPTVQFLKQVAQGRLTLIDEEDMKPRYINSRRSVVALQNQNGMTYAIFTPR